MYKLIDNMSILIYNNNVGKKIVEKRRVVMKKRNVALAIIFTIITIGIYGIYWFVCLTNDSNTLCPEQKTASGGMAILFTIISFGIYGIYWNYKLGEKVGGSGILYLILSLIGFGWVNYILAQSAINKAIENNEVPAQQ